MRLKDKVAVITGGASGMGRATTIRFVEEGASVVIADYNEDTGKQTLAIASDRGFRDQVRFIKTDVAREPEIAAMIDLAVSEFGRLDIVFNNAGVGGALGPSGTSKSMSGITPSTCSPRASSSESSMRLAR